MTTRFATPIIVALLIATGSQTAYGQYMNGGTGYWQGDGPLKFDPPLFPPGSFTQNGGTGFGNGNSGFAPTTYGQFQPVQYTAQSPAPVQNSGEDAAAGFVVLLGGFCCLAIPSLVGIAGTVLLIVKRDRILAFLSGKPQSPPPPTPSADREHRRAMLRDALAAGLITQAEFDAKMAVL